MKEDGTNEPLEMEKQLTDTDAMVEGPENEKSVPEKKSVVGGFTKALVAVLLLLGISTAVIAQTAPQLLAPIANSIPDSFAPLTPTKGKSFGGGC